MVMMPEEDKVIKIGVTHLRSLLQIMDIRPTKIDLERNTDIEEERKCFKHYRGHKNSRPLG
jgi:hypothetical protein